MSTLRSRRGTDAQRLAITPLEGEFIWTTDTDKLYVGDGSTAGGVEVSDAENLPVLPSTEALYKLDVDSSGDGTWVEDLLPDPTSGNSGQVVAVNSSGDDYELIDQSGGGGTSSSALYQSSDFEQTIDESQLAGVVAIPARITQLTTEFDEDTGSFFTVTTTSGQTTITFDKAGFFIVGVEDLSSTFSYSSSFNLNSISNNLNLILNSTNIFMFSQSSNSPNTSGSVTVTAESESQIIQVSANDTLTLVTGGFVGAPGTAARTDIIWGNQSGKIFLYRI